MKKTVITLLTALLAASTSMGALVVYDSFSDSVQTNVSQPDSVPSTWTTTAVIPNTTYPYYNHSAITAGSLSYPGFAASSGNSWTAHQGSDDFTKSVSGITGLNPGDTVYYSFLLKVDPTDAVSQYYMRLYNTANYYSSGLAFSLGLSPDLSQIGFSISSRNYNFSQAEGTYITHTGYDYVSSNTTFLIVAGYSRGADAAHSSVNLWINPDVATFTTGTPPSPTLTLASYANGYATQEKTWNMMEYMFNGSGTGTAGGETIDEFRIATTWADLIETNTAGPVAPIAAFTASPTNGVVSLFTVTFSDTSTGTVTNRYWDFGDGSTTNVTAASVQHIYNSVGLFTVSLTASGPVGSDTFTGTDLITVTAPVVPTASFTASTYTGYEPLSVTFTDTSAGTVTNRYWDFGDGDTTNVTGTTVAHTYLTDGTYTVAMTASGPAGSDTDSQTDLITVQNVPDGYFFITSDVADKSIGVGSNMVPTLAYVSQKALTAGDDNYQYSTAENCAILVFQLPDLGGKALTSANLAIDVTITYPGATNYPVGLDLYGVRYASSVTVLTNDYGYMGSGSGTLIQDDLYTVASQAIYDWSIQETDVSGDAALLAWVADQYTAGAVAGDYVFLRLESDGFTANAWTIASADKTDAARTKPILTLTVDAGLKLLPQPPVMTIGSLGTGQDVINWTTSQGSGYVYSVWYSTNLLNGFQPLETNLADTVQSWTNTINASPVFYKIEAE